MCGIAGVVHCLRDSEQDVKRMIECIGYRGPDESGVVSVGPATVGHARLAVVDPENGKQPMSNEDGTVWVTFNGEIYNYVELRNELKAKGHIFKSRCDTEVLVHLWEEKQEEMLDDLIGMFAFFIWDTKRNKGILARDRQGIKPCYVANYMEGFAFCSEIKGLLELTGFIREINYSTLAQVFTFNYPPPPATCFKGIRHLRPGTYLLFQGNTVPEEKTYWEWPFNASKVLPDYEEFSSLLDDAVRIQMRFDVKGGIFLSGGVDSSVVACHLRKQWNEPVLDSLALDTRISGFTEIEFSRYVADKYGFNLIPVEIRPQYIVDIAEKVIYHTDQPHGDFSFFLFYLLSRAAHQEGKIVMFNGDGPDEALLGFGHNERFFSGPSHVNSGLEGYFKLISYMDEADRQILLAPDFVNAYPAPVETFKGMMEKWKDLSFAEQVCAYELTYLMPGNNLIKGDRMGACWSIEGRSPFLDHRVSELFTRLPIEQKIQGGIGKYYVKDYALTHYERDFIFRPKSMPTLPIGEWVKDSLYDWARDIITSHAELGIFQEDNILTMLEEHRKGKANYTRQLRTILMTKLWYKTFFKK